MNLLEYPEKRVLKDFLGAVCVKLVSSIWVFCQFLFTFELVEEYFEFGNADYYIICANVEINRNCEKMGIVFEIV